MINGGSDFFLYDPASGVWFKCISTPTGFNYEQGAWSPGWEIHPMTLNSDALEDLFLIDLLYDPASGGWYQAPNVVTASFSYNSGFWDPQRTIITRGPIR